MDPISDPYHGIPNGSVTGHEFVGPGGESGSSELFGLSPSPNEGATHHARSFSVKISRMRKKKAGIDEPRPLK